MPYTNCSVCGAKALVGATRCPRCQAPFVSYDLKGERVPTVNCPNCGVQRPVAIGVCPNCLTSTAPAGARLTRGLVGVGLAIVVIMGIGYFISRRVDEKARTAPAAVPATDTALVASSPAPGDSLPVAATDSLNAAASPSSAGVPLATRPATTPAVSPPSTAPAAAPTAALPVSARQTPVDPAMVPPKPAAAPSVAVPDSGRWDFAVAITWVRVRSAPSRESEVLRMVDSAQRVRLGPPTNGWRPVRVGVDRGWVDPRLFTVVPPAGR